MAQHGKTPFDTTFSCVMFDFSGTLFRAEPADTWLAAALASCGLELPEVEQLELRERLASCGIMPALGRGHQLELPPDLHSAWQQRNLDTRAHHEVFTALARRAGLPDPGLAEALYRRHTHPQGWVPYPDVHKTLSELRDRGIPVAVVSNIGWDIRPLFAYREIPVDVFVLSCEHGIQKPDPRIFEIALQALEREQSEALKALKAMMVGDDPHTDGAATGSGADFYQVEHLPVDQRPDAIAAILSLPMA
ncbi:MAG TPA: HAD family hydrolase [Actinocrinis sp.]|nr:HAD family hydrolase [Actinocrinis sp.]